MAAETTIASLPAEIITHEIFSKLPVNSLLRFKCLSKSFYALISSPEFVQFHLRENRSSDANRLLILVGKDGRNLYSIDVDSSDSSVTTIPLPIIIPYKVSIVGSFDGLICVGLRMIPLDTFLNFKHVLINPFTKIFREIPYHKRPPRVAVVVNRFSFGFGFDDLNRDYKLVGVMDIETLDEINPMISHYYREAIVYSVNQNTWKLVEKVEDPIDSLMKRQNSVLIKNHLLHWVFSNSDNYRIGCFDTRSDKWAKDVPLMELTDHNNNNNNNKFRLRSLGVINGCLCLSIKDHRLLNAVWMMKEYGAEESWVILFYIPQFITEFCYFQSIRPFFSFRRGSKYEVLVVKKERNGLVWYDIEQKTYGREEHIIRIPAFTRGCFYKGSLVQIQGGQHIH